LLSLCPPRLLSLKKTARPSPSADRPHVVSDYRFRGISQTDKDFAVQGGLTVSHESGLYASVWGSSVR
jgi:uncharacterized protein (TIGR02001 family)